MESQIIVGVFGLIIVGGVFTLLQKSWHLIDRLTDKIMAERAPVAFNGYAVNTPTKGEPAEAKSFPVSGNGNGKHLVAVSQPNSVEALKESYLKQNPHLEEI